jgi:hypothetical protein
MTDRPLTAALPRSTRAVVDTLIGELPSSLTLLI